MRNKINLQKGNKKLINAWAFYDWANSVYPLVITSTVFPIYYSTISDDFNSIEFLGYHFKNTALIGFVTASVFSCCLENTITIWNCRLYRKQKTFYENFVYTGSISCMGLYFELHNLYMGLFFLLLCFSWFLGQFGFL